MRRVVLFVPLMVAALLLLRAARTADQDGDSRVADARSADHVRRIELALATGRTPLDDHFLDPPRGAQIPEPPLYDALLAAAAELALREPNGPPETGGVREERLEGFLARIDPLLVLLSALFVLLAVRVGERSASADWAAAFASLFFVASTWTLGSRTPWIETARWLGLLAALACWRALLVARERDPTDVVLSGFVLGIVASVALASSPAALLFVPLLTLVYLRRERTAGAELASATRRGGLLLGIVVVVLGELAREGASPSASPGTTTRWLALVPWLGSCMLAPHFSIWLVELWRERRRARALVPAAGLLLCAGLAPRAIVDLFALVEAHGGARAFTALLATSAERTSAWTSLACIAFAAGVAHLRRGVDGTLRGLVLLASIPTVAALAFSNLASLAAPLGAIAIGRALVALGRGPARAKLAAAITGVLAVAIGGAIAFHRRPEKRDAATAAVIEGLRWMRAGTPSAGAWNAAWTPKAWSVAAPWTLGGLVAQHARRPPLASSYGPLVGSEGLRSAREIATERDPAALVASSRRAGVRYLLGGEHVAREWRRALAVESELVREAHDSSALHALLSSLDHPPAPWRVLAGLPPGLGGGPEFLVYELEPAEPSEPPTLRAR